MNQRDQFTSGILDKARDLRLVRSLPEYTYNNSNIDHRLYPKHYRQNISKRGERLLALLPTLNRRNPQRAILLAAGAAVGCLHPHFMLAQKLEERFYEFLLQEQLSLKEKRALCTRITSQPAYRAYLKRIWPIKIGFMLQAARENPAAVAEELRQVNTLECTQRQGQMPLIFLTSFLKEYFELACLIRPMDKQLAKALMLSILNSRGYSHIELAPEDAPDYRLVSETLYALEQEDCERVLTDSAEVYVCLLQHGFPDALYWQDVLSQLSIAADALEHAPQKEKTIRYTDVAMHLSFYSQEGTEIRHIALQRFKKLLQCPGNDRTHAIFLASVCGYVGRNSIAHRNPSFPPDCTHPLYVLATNAYWLCIKQITLHNPSTDVFTALHNGIWRGDEILGDAIAKYFLDILPTMAKKNVAATKSALHHIGMRLFSTSQESTAYQKLLNSIMWDRGIAILESIEPEAALSVKQMTVHPFSRF